MENIYVNASSSVIIQPTFRNAITGQGMTGLTNATVTAYYCRPGGTAQAISLIAASPGDAYSSGKFAEVDSVHMPGTYQVHLPGTCLAVGATEVVISFTAAGMLMACKKVVLIAVDLRDSVHLGISSLPNSAPDATGGLAILGSKMNLIDAPNATAILAIQSGLSKPGTAQTVTAPADMASQATLAAAAGEITIVRKLKQNGFEVDFVGSRALIKNDAGSLYEWMCAVTDKTGAPITVSTNGFIFSGKWVAYVA